MCGDSHYICMSDNGLGPGGKKGHLKYHPFITFTSSMHRNPLCATNHFYSFIEYPCIPVFIAGISHLSDFSFTCVCPLLDPKLEGRNSTALTCVQSAFSLMPRRKQAFNKFTIAFTQFLLSAYYTFPGKTAEGTECRAVNKTEECLPS